VEKKLSALVWWWNVVRPRITITYLSFPEKQEECYTVASIKEAHLMGGHDVHSLSAHESGYSVFFISCAPQHDGLIPGASST